MNKYFFSPFVVVAISSFLCCCTSPNEPEQTALEQFELFVETVSAESWAESEIYQVDSFSFEYMQSPLDADVYVAMFNFEVTPTESERSLGIDGKRILTPDEMIEQQVAQISNSPFDSEDESKAKRERAETMATINVRSLFGQSHDKAKDFYGAQPHTYKIEVIFSENTTKLLGFVSKAKNREHNLAFWSSDTLLSMSDPERELVPVIERKNNLVRTVTKNGYRTPFPRALAYRLTTLFEESEINIESK